jgi:hypothetical protein
LLGESHLHRLLLLFLFCVSFVFLLFAFRFAGSYDAVHGGHLEDAVQSMSGGIYDIYHTELVLSVTTNKPIEDPATAIYKTKLCHMHAGSIDRVVPNLEEFYHILRCAIKSNNLIGCFSMNVNCCHFAFIFSQTLEFKISRGSLISRKSMAS